MMSIKRTYHNIDSGQFRFTMETGCSGLEMLDTLSDAIGSLTAAYEAAIDKYGLSRGVPPALRWNGYEWVEIK